MALKPFALILGLHIAVHQVANTYEVRLIPQIGQVKILPRFLLPMNELSFYFTYCYCDLAKQYQKSVRIS
jgi:hypothetical protein